MFVDIKKKTWKTLGDHYLSYNTIKKFSVYETKKNIFIYSLYDKYNI